MCKIHEDPCINGDCTRQTREVVIATAKTLAQKNTFPRFFLVSGEIWECYRGEYLPDTGERAWVAEKINLHKI